MSKFPVAEDDVAAVFSQLTDPVIKQATYYDGSMICCPDQYDPTIQAAINNLPQARKDVLKGHAGTVRFSTQCKGIHTDVGSGKMVHVDTNPGSQAQINGSALQAENDPSFTAYWKQMDGTFILLNAQELQQMRINVVNYVNGCFDTERNCDEQIDVGAITTNTQIDDMFTNYANANP